MSLEEYRKKRDFGKTPEPNDQISTNSQPPIFVVQKHAASHLHYDFRIEVNGVLKSWSIPKGPSLNPEDKHLAVMVEDHPYDYKDFEGVIPEGNYGAGTVMVWDQGNYRLLNTITKKEIDVEAEKEINNGHLTLILDGEKLKGEFALIRLKRGNSKEWLVIKKRDDYASDQPIINNDLSIKTGRIMEEIKKNPKDIWFSEINEIFASAPKGMMPHKIKPMLAFLYNKPFSDKEWLFEIKWDGYRAITEIENGQISLYSRNLNSFADRFPELINSLKRLRHNVILDGEIVALDQYGRPNFGWLQNYKQKPTGNLIYYVFDILFLDGRNLESLPLLDRKMILKEILPASLNFIRYCDHVSGEEGEDFFKLIRDNDLEGIMAKKIKSSYLPGIRSMNWLKIKNQLVQEFIIGGYLESEKRELKSLLVGMNSDKGLQFAGNVGTGFDDITMKKMLTLFRENLADNSAFFDYKKEIPGQHWIKPRFVCEIKFAEWTNDQKLRQPVFIGLRDDIEPSQVKVEEPIDGKKS